jgi:DNA-binding CsgD family transcriptional regulator
MPPGTSQLEHTLHILRAAACAAGEARAFTRESLRALATNVGADLTTLSVCNLRTGHRRVVSVPANALHARDIECFDRLFHLHPLVRFHAAHPQGPTHRISDSLSRAQFRRTALYADYYRRIGIEHVAAVPLHVDQHYLVSFVLNRSLRDFSDTEVAALDFLRGPIAALYRQVQAMAELRRSQAVSSSGAHDERALALTSREREVLRWVAAGKTDAQIAQLCGASVRTVQKHLQHAYVKLGVENRTAAAMRILGHGVGSPAGRA